EVGRGPDVLRDYGETARPYLLILLYKVMRLMPSSAAALRRFPRFRWSTSAIRPLSARALDVASVVGSAVRPNPSGRPTDGEAPDALRGWNDSGRSSRRMTGPSQRATARSMTLRSSRTLPGQECP